MLGASYSRVPAKVSQENLTRGAAPGGKGVKLPDFSTLKRNTFGQVLRHVFDSNPLNAVYGLLNEFECLLGLGGGGHRRIKTAGARTDLPSRSRHRLSC